jgi:nicotinamide-nucleotide amidase
MLHMLAEIISIGDELTSGQRLDTNSQWLAERLGELGIRTLYHTTVADDLAANVAVFRSAVERADVVVATGGLGPTADDLTREALAAVAGVELALDEPSLAHIRGLFARRRRPMPERNVVQAMFPAGSRAILNPHGSAPGIDITIARQSRAGQCRIFALPGVPDEMREMWAGSVAGELSRLAGGRVIRHRRIKCFGAGESDLEAMLPDLIRRGRDPSVGITVSGATITLRITAEGASAEECYARMQPTIDTIHECLGTLVFGEEDEELEHVVARLLRQCHATLATAEWGTGGLVARWLAEVPEAAAHYLGGLVVGNDAALRATLGIASVREGDAGLVSADTVAHMARACRDLLAADYGLAVGPLPPVDPHAPQPHALHFALASAAGVEIKSSPFAAHPAILKPRAAKQALDLVRLELLRNGK